jgi:hypothetical protein
MPKPSEPVLTKGNARRMPNTKTRRKPTDIEVLAALARTLRNEQHANAGGVWLSDVAQHLAMMWHSGTSRILKPIMDRLSDQGLVVQSGRDLLVFTLTDAGWLRFMEASVTLPESPQRRRWREARELADKHQHQMWKDVIAALTELSELINATEPVPAIAWLECGKRLKRRCEAMAHVNYALYESVDPKDGPATGERWTEFWIPYGLIYRHVVIPRRKNAIDSAANGVGGGVTTRT